MQLKEFTIRKAKPKEKAYRLSDGGSLFLLIKPNGSKLWQFRFRFRGKENVLSFGPYPLVTIAEARQKRDQAKKLLLDGIDPAVKKKQDRLEAEALAKQTFGLLADEYIEQKKILEVADATLVKITWLLPGGRCPGVVP